MRSLSRPFAKRKCDVLLFSMCSWQHCVSFVFDHAKKREIAAIPLFPLVSELVSEACGKNKLGADAVRSAHQIV